MKQTIGGVRAGTGELALRTTVSAIRPPIEAAAGRKIRGCFSLLTSAAHDQRCLVAYPRRDVYECARWGHVAEWLRNGLQNRALGFDSRRGLHPYNQWLRPIIREAPASRPRSAGGVPALGKRNQRPRAPVVVGGTRRRKKALGLDHESILRSWCNGRLNGFQQQIVFDFAHRTLRGSRGDDRKCILFPD